MNGTMYVATLHQYSDYNTDVTPIGVFTSHLAALRFIVLYKRKHHLRRDEGFFVEPVPFNHYGDVIGPYTYWARAFFPRRGVSMRNDVWLVEHGEVDPVEWGNEVRLCHRTAMMPSNIKHLETVIVAEDIDEASSIAEQRFNQWFEEHLTRNV